MYKINHIKIDGFWHRHSVETAFNEEVNVIIGRNGTGKTTFMNILQAILAVDVVALYDNHFDSASIVLVNEQGQKKTIKATKVEDNRRPFPYVEYKISSRKYTVMLVGADDGRRPVFLRRQVNEESSVIRDALSELLSLASLSVYRIRNGVTEPDARDRESAKRYASPVDFRLFELIDRLTRYQLELAQKAQEISIELQKEVLTSLLYEKETGGNSIRADYDAAEEKRKLLLAYSQLGITGSYINKRISDHVGSIDNFVKNLAAKNHGGILLGAFEAKRRTDKVVTLSLEAAKKREDVYSQINLFVELIGSFITDKKFSLVGGELKVEAEGPLPIDKLSSGEKQLLILLIEAVLQRQEPYIFLADEPELSLHIAWQRKIVPAVKKMNPNAQIIVATHSPELAGRYPQSLIDMEDMIHGAA